MQRFLTGSVPTCRGQRAGSALPGGEAGRRPQLAVCKEDTRSADPTATPMRDPEWSRRRYQRLVFSKRGFQMALYRTRAGGGNWPVTART